MTASELWSRNWLTDSTDSPTSRRSLAAVCRRTWTPDERKAGQAEVATEAVIEGSAGDAVGDLRPPARGTRWVAWKQGPCRHHQEIGVSPSQSGSGELTTAAHTALAGIAVEGGGFVEGDVAGGQVDDLGPASAGENESEDDGEVALLPLTLYRG